MKTQLRLTTSKPYSLFERIFDGYDQERERYKPYVKPKEVGILTMDALKGESAYLDGDAQRLAGNDIVVFLDGDLNQMDNPVDEQDILLLLPSGEYACKAILQPSNTYHITLKQSVEG